MLAELQLADKRIILEAQILGQLRNIAYMNVRRDRALRAAVGEPTLPLRYGGTGFPLRQSNGTKIPSWRNISPWMKIQIASLVLAERGFRPFKVHLHDDLREHLEAESKDQREYMRDAVKRQLRRLYGTGNTPLFFMALEDRDGDGKETRPHAHGSIEVRPLPVASILVPKDRRHVERIERAHGKTVAEKEAGRWATKWALRSAAGLVGSSRPRVARSGIDQCRNVWIRQPTFKIFNHHWVDYVFKNAGEFSRVLPDNRLVLPHDLRGEARRAWASIRG